MKVIQCVIFTLSELTLTGDEGQLILRNARDEMSLRHSYAIK